MPNTRLIANCPLRAFMFEHQIDVQMFGTMLCAFNPALKQNTVLKWYMGKSISDRNKQRINKAFTALNNMGNKRELQWAQETQA